MQTLTADQTSMLRQILEGLKEQDLYSSTNKDRLFTRQTFKLDTAVTRSSDNKNRFGQNWTAFWVYSVNSASFDATIYPGGDSNLGDGLPLVENMAVSLPIRQIGAVLEWPAQPGVEIEIIFFHIGDFSPGQLKQIISGNVTPDYGATHSSSKKTATATRSVLLTADPDRKLAVLQHKSGGSVWIGNPAELDDADYKNICTEWMPGDFVELPTKGAISWKSDSGSVVFSCMELKE